MICMYYFLMKNMYLHKKTLFVKNLIAVFYLKRSFLNTPIKKIIPQHYLLIEISPDITKTITQIKIHDFIASLNFNPIGCRIQNASSSISP